MLSSNIFRYLDEPICSSLFWPEITHVGHKRKHNQWTASIPVSGYEPSEVAIKEETSNEGNSKIIIHAKHESEDDFSEMKKVVKIPKNVDHEHLRTILSKDGVLILKAPYKESVDSYVQPLKIKRTDTWNGIWGELGRLNEQMNHLIDSHAVIVRPRTEFIADGNGVSGTWRLKFNIGKDFKSDEIKLRHHNKQIHLEARRETKTDNDYSSKYINEVISIPDEVEADKLKSKLLDDGELIVEAPCKKMPSLDKGETGKAIPIEATNKSVGNDKMTVEN